MLRRLIDCNLDICTYTIQKSLGTLYLNDEQISNLMCILKIGPNQSSHLRVPTELKTRLSKVERLQIKKEKQLQCLLLCSKRCTIFYV